MNFEACHIPIAPVNGVTDWPAWGTAIMEQIKAAPTAADLSQIIYLNVDAFAECCEKAPKAYWSLDDALGRRRLQIRAGV